MNKTEIHGQINSLLEQLINNNRVLESNNDGISQLEIDAMRKKCIELYDLILTLSLTDPDNSTLIDEVIESVLETEVESIEIEEILDNEIEPIEEINEEEEVQVVDEVQQNKKVEDSKDELEFVNNNEPDRVEVNIEIPKPVELETKSVEFETPKFVPIVEKPIPVYSPPPKINSDERSILEKITETPAETSIHQKFSMQNDEKALFEKFANFKLNKITAAIDISKRFELQNNLFGGESESYSRSILALEEAGDKSSALEIFNNLAKKHKWDTENDLVQELKSYIYRKY